MKKYLIIILFFCVGLRVTAQKMKSYFALKTELTTPVGNGEFGYGLSLKYLFPLNKRAGISFSIGSNRLDQTQKLLAKKDITRIRFLQIGYQYNLQKFYIEPKVGIGELGGQVFLDSAFITTANPSVASLLSGVEIGYNIKRFQVGVNFVHLKGIEKQDAGLWYNRSLSFASIFIAIKL